MHFKENFVKKNRSYNQPDSIFEEIDVPWSSTIDDRIATVNFLKHSDEPAIGNDGCYARRMKHASMKS